MEKEGKAAEKGRRRGIKASEKGRRRGKAAEKGRRGEGKPEGCREGDGEEGCRAGDGEEGCREGDGEEGCREGAGEEGCREREGEGCREGAGEEGCREREGEGCREGEGEEGCRKREKEREAVEKGKGKRVRGPVARVASVRRETITASLERVRHLLHKLQCLCTRHPAEVVCLICLVCSPNTSLSCLLAKHEQWKFLEGEKKHHNMGLFFLHCLLYYVYHIMVGNAGRIAPLLGYDGSLASKGYISV